MKKFAQAIRSEGVPRSIGALAIATFLLGALMSVFSVVSALRVRAELTTVFSEVSRGRIEQGTMQELLARVIDAETALRGYGLVGDQAFLKPYTHAKREIPLLQARSAKAISPISPDRTRFNQLLGDAVASIDAAVASAKQLWPSTERLREDVIAIKSKLDSLRDEERMLNDLMTERLDVRRAGAAQVISQLLFATVILAIGLVLLAFSQLREMALQAARYLRFETAQRDEITHLNHEVALSRRELESLHRQLSIALRSASIQVFTITRNANIVWVADEASHVSMLSHAPLDLAGLASPKDRAALQACLNRVFEQGEARDLEIRLARGDERAVWLRLHFAPSESPGEDHLLGCAFDITALKEREQSNFWLMRELSHRSKNLLAIVQSIARQTGKTAIDKDAFLTRFSGRLQGLAASHDLLVKTEYAGTGLEPLILSQMNGAEVLVGNRIKLKGPEVFIRAEAAQNLGMALHELYTNAKSHGALRNGEGRLDVNWRIEAEGEETVLLIDWVETSIPPASAELGKGFGDMLIRVNLPRSLEGNVQLDHAPEGTRCQMSLPMRRLRPDDAVKA